MLGRGATRHCTVTGQITLMARTALLHSSLLAVLASFCLHLTYATSPVLQDSVSVDLDKRSVDVDDSVDDLDVKRFNYDLVDRDDLEKRYASFRHDLGKREEEEKRGSPARLRDLGKRLQAFRYDLGKRSQESDVFTDGDDNMASLLGYTADDVTADLEKRMYRADLGKRAMYRADLGKRAMYRADLGKRAMYRADLGKRAMYRADLGKRTMFRADQGKRMFRADLGKRMYRADLGKRSAEEVDAL